jgi:hypothetical protein
MKRERGWVGEETGEVAEDDKKGKYKEQHTEI